MSTTSKIRFFFISLVITTFLVSCEKNKNDVIPDDHVVSFAIDLMNDIQFSDLNAIGNSVIVTARTNNWGSRASGYNGNGIIVYRATLEDFYAYDRTCPHDFVIDGSANRVNIDFIQAVCPVCSTSYSLPVGGRPISGPGKYPLKNYRAVFNGQYVIVENY